MLGHFVQAGPFRTVRVFPLGTISYTNKQTNNLRRVIVDCSHRWRAFKRLCALSLPPEWLCNMPRAFRRGMCVAARSGKVPLVSVVWPCRYKMCGQKNATKCGQKNCFPERNTLNTLLGSSGVILSLFYFIISQEPRFMWALSTCVGSRGECRYKMWSEEQNVVSRTRTTKCGQNCWPERNTFLTWLKAVLPKHCKKVPEIAALPPRVSIQSCPSLPVLPRQQNLVPQSRSWSWCYLANWGGLPRGRLPGMIPSRIIAGYLNEGILLTCPKYETCFARTLLTMEICKFSDSPIAVFLTLSNLVTPRILRRQAILKTSNRWSSFFFNVQVSQP